MLRNIIFNDWFTILFLVCLVFIAFAKYLDPKKFYGLANILINSNYLKIYLKDQKFINRFDGVLFLNLIISLTVFTIISLNTFGISKPIQNIKFYYQLCLGIGAIILIKMVIDKLFGSLFNLNKLMHSYVFQKITFKNLIGLILLPINILLIYTIIPSKIIIYFIISILLIINTTGFFMSIRSYQNIIKSNMFYFILYLCTLEIAPYLILFKVIKSY